MTAVLDRAADSASRRCGLVTGPVAEQMTARLLSREFDRWAEQSAACGHCARPVRLVGQSQTVDVTTGAVVGSYASAGEPDGVTYVQVREPPRVGVPVVFTGVPGRHVAPDPGRSRRW